MRPALCTIILAAFLPAQHPPALTSDEVARKLDALIAEMDIVRAKAQGARRRAALASTPEDERGLVRVLAELGHELEGMAGRLVLIDSIHARIAKAMKLDTLAEVQDAIEVIEAEMLEDLEAGMHGAQRRVALARFHLAQVLLEQAGREIHSSTNDRRGEKLLLRARAKYREMLDKTDVQVDGIASSSHAIALRGIVKVETCLYEGYLRLSRENHNARSHAANARRHRKAAEVAFDQLVV